MKSKLFLVILLNNTLFCQTLYIVANKNFPQDKLTQKEIKAIYLDQKRYIHGKKILPLNFNHDNDLRNSFEKHILQKSRKLLERYWIKAHYKGHRPPKVLKSKASLVSFIQNIDTTIGYIDGNISKLKNIKILLQVELK
jgi:ABC-type phosphate transport system substrate-binding protein